MATRRRAIGLMSGTSMDGVDAALVETDGETVAATGPAATRPYPEALRRDLAAALGARERTPAIDALERALTDLHADAAAALMAEAGLTAADIDVVGLHGQTLTHAPEAGWTWQLGDGARLADRLGVPAVFDFRAADMAAGGQGAPLAPVYHRALAAGLEMPVAFLNLGGVGNLTFVADARAAPVGFDTGPGNALLDDLLARRTGAAMDRDGRAAAAGRVDARALDALLAHPYFDRPYPKSLDRNAFDAGPVADLPLADAAATLAAFTAETVVRAAALLPAAPARWLVCGGGRRNPAIMAALAARLPAPVAPVEEIGADGDALEAQAFAFLAVRRLDGLPVSFPETTGCARPTVGGRIARPDPAGAAGGGVA